MTGEPPRRDPAPRARVARGTMAPLPDPDFEPLRGFWAGAAAGELRIPRCAACGAWVWYPRPRCDGCGADALVWTATSGRGTLFSWAVVRRALWQPYAPFVPYATGLVALAEAPHVRIVTRLVDCEVEALAVDMPVHAVFRPLRFEGDPRSCIAPFFTPTPTRAGQERST